jgi:hypothetical protein
MAYAFIEDRYSVFDSAFTESMLPSGFFRSGVRGGRSSLLGWKNKANFDAVPMSRCESKTL